MAATAGTDMIALVSTIRRRATGFVARQFGRPAGPLGHLVSRVLARGNGGFNRWLVAEVATQVAAPSTVIEIGCGPGVALQQMLIAFPQAKIIGVDRSPVVLKAAERRNADAVRMQRLQLVEGDVTTTSAHGPADLIVACHVVYFWTDPVRELRQIREALTPAGHLALGYQLRPHMPPVSQQAFPAEGFIVYDSDGDLAQTLADAGFSPPDIRIFGDPDHPGGRLALTTPRHP